VQVDVQPSVALECCFRRIQDDCLNNGSNDRQVVDTLYDIYI